MAASRPSRYRTRAPPPIRNERENWPKETRRRPGGWSSCAMAHQLSGPVVSGSTPHRLGGRRALPCCHEPYCADPCSSPPVRRRRFLLRWPGHRRRRPWLGALDRADCLSHGWVSNEELTGRLLPVSERLTGPARPKPPGPTLPRHTGRPAATRRCRKPDSPSSERADSKRFRTDGECGRRRSAGRVGTAHCSPSRPAGARAPGGAGERH